eukprot:COSAG02_NODE_1823_length_10761_cov_32.341868_3_plen_33_part_00
MEIPQVCDRCQRNVAQFSANELRGVIDMQIVV